MKQTKAVRQTAHCRRNAVKHGMYGADIYSVRHYLRAFQAAISTEAVLCSHNNKLGTIPAAVADVGEDVTCWRGQLG